MVDNQGWWEHEVNAKGSSKFLIIVIIIGLKTDPYDFKRIILWNTCLYGQVMVRYRESKIDNMGV